MRASKTGRVRGLAVAVVRSKAKELRTFTADDLVPPFRSRDKVLSLLQHMTRTGELYRLRPGKRGRLRPVAAVYCWTGGPGA